MISVIIPVYNVEKYLRQCIDSVLDSDYHDYELILVNDGSTDQSPEICEEYAARDNRIKVIHQENSGVSMARNHGLDCSRGEWIVFIDADDSITPDFLGMIVREEYKDKDFLLFDFTICRRRGFERSCSVKPLSEQGEDMQRLIELSLRGKVDFGACWARAYRREIIERYPIRFSPQLSVGEDMMFNMEYWLRTSSYTYISEPVYIYNIRRDSTTHSFRANVMENHIKLQDEIMDFLLKCGIFSVVAEKFYSYSLENMAYVLTYGIFNPRNPISFAEKKLLCEAVQENEIYREAMAYNCKTGILPRKVLVFLFSHKFYHTASLLCRLIYEYLKRKDF